MSEIVVAYARADKTAAVRVIKKLESLGFTVRHEDKLSARRGGKTKPAARLALVSRRYPAARLRGATLVARLEPVTLPYLKTPLVDLRAWRGREDHRGWRQLKAKLGAPGRAGKRPIVVKTAAKAPKPAKKGAVGPTLFWLAGAAAAAAGGVAAFMAMH